MARVSMTDGDDVGKYVSRLMLPLSLTYDHRAIDGAAEDAFSSSCAMH